MKRRIIPATAEPGDTPPLEDLKYDLRASYDLEPSHDSCQCT